jgi:predicted HD phosphohydrolase
MAATTAIAVPSSGPSTSSAFIPSASASVDTLFALFHSHGSSDYIGEPVSSIAHALQAAACAAAAGATEEVIAGALLHDVGHLLGIASPDKYERMGDCGVMAHEGIGAAWLERLGVPPVTAAIVRRHVDAKRYLTAVDASYYGRLSAASKTTLGYQGGPMSPEEVASFQADPLMQTILDMRRWDEAAKIPDLEVPSLESYRPMLEKIIGAHLAAMPKSDNNGDGE